MTDAIKVEGEVIESNADAIPSEPNALVIKSFDSIVASVVNEAQFTILQGRTPKRFIKRRPGKGGLIFSYVPHGYVTAVLNRAFGFDWDWEILPIRNGQMFEFMEAQQGMKYGSVLVHGKLTVRIRHPEDPTQVIAEICKSATGEKEAIKGFTWGALVKSAESDAFKKAASRLGVALDLYWQDGDEDYMPPDEEEVLKKKVREMTGTPKQIADELGVSPAQVVKWRKE